MRISLHRNPSNQPGEILARVMVSKLDDPPDFHYSHSFIYKVPSGDDGEIIVYPSETDAASGVNGCHFPFDLEKCRNEKCKQTPGGCQEIKNKRKRHLVADVFHTKPKQNALQFFGTALFKALFSSTAEDLLRETEPMHANGRIFLQINDRDLDAIPWEYAKDGTLYLVHDRKFTRLLPQDESPRDPLPELPLHIVVVAPDPLDLHEKGYTDLHLGDQFQYLVNEFHGDDINVMLERVLPATVNKVNSLIAKPDNKMAPVLHFMGHCVTHNRGRGLLFEDKDTIKCKIVHAQTFLNVPRNLRLAFLSACNSREVARVLAQNGVRHTIGSHCDLPDDIARKFEAQYYQYLSYGLSVDETMWRARTDYRDGEDIRQTDYLAGAMILYSTTCHTNDSKFLREAGELIIKHNTCANNLDVIPSPKIFFGRKDQLATLNATLRRMATRTSESANVQTITGICGQGKTMLAMKAVHRNSHFFPGGIFVWQFDDEKEISFIDYLRNLADVLFPKLLTKVAQNDADEVKFLKHAIFKIFNASTLLILDHADTLIRAAKVKGDASDLVTWLQSIVSWENTPVKILATSSEALKWPEENLIQLDGFIDSDIHSGCKLFFRYLNEEAKETIMANKQRKELLRDIVIRVDGHPLSLILLSRAASDKLLKDLACKHYRIMLANTYYLESLRDIFKPTLNALSKQLRLLLYIYSLFPLPAGKENLIKVSKFFDDDVPSAESVAPGDQDIKQLHRRGLLIKEGDDKYRCPVAIWVTAKDFHSDFKLRIFTTNDGVTPLYQATELLHKSLSGEFAAEMNAKNQAGWTPLHLAANQGQVDLVKLLFEVGAEANCKCDDGRTPLYLAAENGYIDVVKLLITFGVDVNLKRNDGRVPLHIAAQRGHVEVVKLLADVNVKADDYGMIPLHYAALNGYVEVVKLLIASGVDMNAMTKDGRAPLHLAAQNGHLEVVKLLITSGVDMNAKMNDGRAPLHLAAQNGHVEVMKLFTISGADVNAKCNNGLTPLNYASDNGRVEEVKLLDPPVIINNYYGGTRGAMNSNGDTPLHTAIKNRQFDVVSMLVRSENVNATNPKNGATPLHYAAYFGHSKIVQLLLDNGANPLTKNTVNGKTPEQAAARGNHEDIAKLIRDHISSRAMG